MESKKSVQKHEIRKNNREEEWRQRKYIPKGNNPYFKMNSTQL